MYQIENKPDMASVLSNLAGIIRDHSDPVNQYLRQIGQQVITDPFQSNRSPVSIKISGSIPDRERRDLFSSCRIIEFADWAGVQDASRLWDRLYTEVIKPLKKRDFQFIFHLGDTAKKLVFETDEVLDIIGDYTTYGKVTLMLEKEEAGSLWCKLNGLDPDADFSGPGSSRAREKCLSLFNTMNIDSLVILHDYSAVQLSRDGQFALPGRPPLSIREIIDTRARFSAGFQLGILLELEPPHCMALGLAVSAGESSSGGNASQLLVYLHDWIKDYDEAFTGN